MSLFILRLFSTTGSREAFSLEIKKDELADLNKDIEDIEELLK